MAKHLSSVDKEALVNGMRKMKMKMKMKEDEGGGGEGGHEKVMGGQSKPPSRTEQ